MPDLKHQVYSDNVDTNLFIDGNEWLVVEMRVELTLGHQADYADFKIVPTQDTQEALPEKPTLPEPDGLLGKSFTMDIQPQLDEGGRGTETRIFTGNLSNLSQTGTGLWEGQSFDPSYRVFNTGSNFMNSILYLPAATGAEDLQEDDNLVSEEHRAFVYGPGSGTYSATPSYGSLQSYNTPSGTQISSTELVDFMLEQTDIEDYEKHFAEGGVDQGNGNLAGYDLELYFSEDVIRIHEALDRLQTAAQAAWWFDRFGTFHIGAPVQGNPVNQYDIIFITDTSAGKTTPAYRSVRVIGSGVVSEGGWGRTNMNAEEPTIVEGSDLEEGEELAPPVYTYRNMALQTNQEAENARDELLNKLNDQRGKGKITIVGMPEVRPRDTVRLPSSDIQPMGGEKFGVTKVIHKINDSDGFITDVHVGGIRNEQEAFYETVDPDGQYGRFYAYINSRPATSGGPGYVQ